MESLKCFKNFQTEQKPILKEEFIFEDGSKDYICGNVVLQIYHFLRAKAKIFFLLKFLSMKYFGEMLKNFVVVIFMGVRFSVILLFCPRFIVSLIL